MIHDELLSGCDLISSSETGILLEAKRGRDKHRGGGGDEGKPELPKQHQRLSRREDF